MFFPQHFLGVRCAQWSLNAKDWFLQRFAAQHSWSLTAAVYGNYTAEVGLTDTAQCFSGAVRHVVIQASDSCPFSQALKFSLLLFLWASQAKPLNPIFPEYLS